MDGLASQIASQLWIALIHVNLGSFKSLSCLMIIWGLTVHYSNLYYQRFPNTSSTAQGGGGSFKDMKPIGKFGCCEPWMAERTHWWIERWLECRSIYLSICVSIYLCIYLSTYLPTYLSFYLSIYLSIYVSASLSLYLFICRSYSARLSWNLEVDSWKTKLSARLPSHLEADNIKNAAVLRDFLNLRNWQRQKRSNSARLPSKMESRVRPRANAFCDCSTPSV